jgi:acyl-CoA thioesterase-2
MNSPRQPPAQPPAGGTINTVQPELGCDPQWDRTDIAALLLLKRGEDGAFYTARADLNLHGVMFGGQLVSQAIAAAIQGVDDNVTVHCVQVNFLTAGRAGSPMRFEVRQLLKGRQFTVQQVLGSQDGRTVISANVSCHRGEPGPEFQQPMPADVPAPEDLGTLRDVLIERAGELPEWLRKRVGISRALDLRPVDPDGFLFRRDAADAGFRYWIRAQRELPAAPWIQQAAFGYLSDYWFPMTGLAAHVDLKIASGLYVASLNHTVWFHRPLRADDWLLFDARSVSTTQSRGLSSARVWTRDGRLVADIAQESLFRGWIEQDGEFHAPGISDQPPA